MEKVRKVLLRLLIFALSVIGGAGFLMAAGSVPDSAVEEHFAESAELLCERRVFYYVIDGVEPSHIDRYADSILMNIAWNLQSDLGSVMWDSYYFTEDQNENDNFSDTVNLGYTPNREYMRYWHGSAGVMRLLHVFFNLGQIYIFNYILIAVLSLVLVIMLLRRGEAGSAIAICIGLLAVSIWFVPLSLEYTWVFIIMLLLCIVCVSLQHRALRASASCYDKYDEVLGYLFFFAGIVTNYLDFLSAETITFTVPLIILCRMRIRGGEREKRPLIRFLAVNSISWAAGYIGMWLAKWVMFWAVTGESFFGYIGGHIEERLGYGVEDLNYFLVVPDTIYTNVRCLFPAGYGWVGAVAAALIVLALSYVCFVYRRKEISGLEIWVYAAIGIIPYVRFLILLNHSYLHAFFAYRAQLCSVMAVCFTVMAIVDGRYFSFEGSKGKRA